MLLKSKSFTDTLKCFYGIEKAENDAENSFLYNHIRANSVTVVFTPEFTPVLWVELPTKFSQKTGRGDYRMSIFGGSLLGKRGDIFQEGCSLYIKSKLKSEIFSEKKKLINKNILSVITKNLS